MQVPCTDYQHEGEPEHDDAWCSTCAGTGWVAE